MGTIYRGELGVVFAGPSLTCSQLNVKLDGHSPFCPAQRGTHLGH